MELNSTRIKRLGSYLITLWLILFSNTTLAQVRFSTVTGSAEISLNDYFQVDYTIENAKSVESFSPPVFKNFKVVQGPSQSNNVTIINGVKSSSESITYILQPEQTGRQLIPGAIAVIDGKTMRSNPVSINIIKGNRRQQQQPSNITPFVPDIPDEPQVDEEYRLRPGENVNEKIAKNLLVKLNVSKTTCYEGEPIIATYKLYSRVKSESRITKRPSLNGFSVYDMADPREQNISVEKVSEKLYNVHVIRRSQLLPLQAGTYTLEPVELDNKVEFVRVNGSSSRGNDRSNNPMQRIIDQFFSREEAGELETHSVTLKSNPVTITVRPLPQENKPEGFNGAVGKFTMAAVLKNKAVAAGDVAELQVNIKGSGNLPVINAPQIKLPAGMETFDPTVKEDVDKTVYPLSGSKTFNYPFIANETGDFTIPAVRFSYFDPVSSSYKIINSEPFAIHIAEGKQSAGKKDKEEVISPVVTSNWTDIVTRQMLLYGLGIISGMAILFFLLKRSRRKERPVKNISSTAVTAPPADPLREARQALDEGKSQVFYSEINRAVREAICRKTGSLPSELTKFNMPFLLREKGIAVETIQTLEDILKECEIALYTPIHEESDMKEVLEKATTVMVQKLGRESV